MRIIIFFCLFLSLQFRNILFKFPFFSSQFAHRPFDERFDFANKPTEQLYTCLTNENSISNLSTGEHFTNGISSISNNLTNGHYSIDRANRNTTTAAAANNHSPNQANQQIYEYNLAELALLDNQRAQQYIQQQQQQNRHRQANKNTSAKQTTADHLQDTTVDQQQQQFSNNLNNNNHDQLDSVVDDEETPPPLPPLPRLDLLKRNYYANIYSAPPQYTDPDYSDSLALNFSNPPQYTPSIPSNVPIYGQANSSNLQNTNQTQNLETEFNGCTSSNLIHNSSSNTLNKNNTHLPHHPNQNSLLTSMDGKWLFCFAFAKRLSIC